MPDKQPNLADEIHVTEAQVSIDEAGRVIINNPDLAKAIKEARSRSDYNPLRAGVFCPDWKCK